MTVTPETIVGLEGQIALLRAELSGKLDAVSIKLDIHAEARTKVGERVEALEKDFRRLERMVLIVGVAAFLGGGSITGTIFQLMKP